jgi:hypothetical protein
MLKINKNQVVPGQKIEIDRIAHLTRGGIIYLDTEKCYGQPVGTFEPGDVLEITSKIGGNSVVKLRFKNDEHDFEFSTYWSEIKKCTTLGQFENLGEGTVEYVIFYNGKKWKPKKFKDLGKVKASLMDAMGYTGRLWDMTHKHFADRCPEIVYGGAPYWVGYDEAYGRKEFANFEIFEWSNRKLGKKVDFDPVAYYDSLQDFIRVTAQFGSAVRQQYKTYKDDSEYKYILCFVHEDYRSNQRYTPDYDYLKESQIIKDAMKASGVKGTKKCTKAGKTAICFKTVGDMMKVARELNEDEYYVLDMQGRELEEQSAEFVVSMNRANQIDEILNDLV